MHKKARIIKIIHYLFIEKAEKFILKCAGVFIWKYATLNDRKDLISVMKQFQ